MIDSLFSQNHAVTLEQIKVFVLVYEFKSISIAAKQLNKSQPAITQNITQLENKLGIKLVNRQRGKSTSFTEDGHRFYQDVTPALTQLLLSIDEIEHRNTLSIGVCDDMPIEVQMAMYDELSTHTSCHIRLSCDFSANITDMVQDGRLSFAITNTSIASDMSSDTQDKPTNPNGSHQFFWLANSPMQFDEVDKLNIVTAHAGCFVRSVLEAALSQANKRYQLTYVSNHLAGQAVAIAQGYGVGILYQRWQQQFPDLVVLDEQHGFPTLPNFRYELHGRGETLNHHKAEQILQRYVRQLNFQALTEG